jgi:uncharacterized membrane protein
MTDLIVIGYDDEETADKAAAEVERLAKDEPEAVATIRRDEDGEYHAKSTHHPVATGASWGMLWGAVFGLIFFNPVLGLAVGAALGALLGAIAKAGLDRQFISDVRDMVQPGTSALFLIVEKGIPEKAIEALSRFGGRVLKTSLTHEAEQQIQEALHGSNGQSAERSDAVPTGAS